MIRNARDLGRFSMNASLILHTAHVRTTPASVGRMQATVETYDPSTASGSALTDEGNRLEFDRAAVEGGHLRHLRPGQRVHVDLAADGTVTGLRIF
jgi:cold shock CspA family protein